MKYISIGSVNRPSTEHIVYVSHCGYDYTLTADLAAVWLDGRFGFDQVRNQLQTKALRQLERMGLVVITEDVLEGEYRALTKVRLVPAKSKNPYLGLSRNEKTALKWITDTGLVLSMAELVYLMALIIESSKKKIVDGSGMTTYVVDEDVKAYIISELTMAIMMKYDPTRIPRNGRASGIIECPKEI